MQPPSLVIALLRASDKEKHGLPFYIYIFFYFVRIRQADPALIVMRNARR